MKKIMTAEEVISRTGLDDEKMYIHVETGAFATGAEWKETLRQIERDGGAEFDKAFDADGNGAALAEIENLKLKIEVMREAGFPNADIETVIDAEGKDFLTENTGRDGRIYIWYFDGEHEACADIETGDFVSSDRISMLFE